MPPPIRADRDMANRLRKAMPAGEVRLWARLRRAGLGHRFRCQHPIGPYAADFACIALRLIIEVDGDSHFMGKAAERFDAERTAFLEENGWRVLRFTNVEVARDIDAVCRTITLACEEETLRRNR